jgi:hypothetical protein
LPFDKVLGSVPQDAVVDDGLDDVIAGADGLFDVIWPVAVRAESVLVPRLSSSILIIKKILQNHQLIERRGMIVAGTMAGGGDLIERPATVLLQIFRGGVRVGLHDLHHFRPCFLEHVEKTFSDALAFAKALAQLLARNFFKKSDQVQVGAQIPHLGNGGHDDIV